MNGNVLGLVQQGLFFGFLISAAIAAASLVLYPVLRRKMKSLGPDLQSALIFLWCVLPVASALAFVFLALLPSVLQILGLGTDHCLGHPEGHIHFCLVHAPPPVESWQVWAPAGLFLGMLARILLYLALELRESGRFERRLRSYRISRREGFNLLESDTPFALSCGLLGRHIYISTGLLAGLTSAERDIIVAHERAHIVRRDAWRGLLARAFSLAHWPGLRRRLLSDLDLSTELSCDLSSTRIAGDAGKVASLLLKVERLYKTHFTPCSPMFAGVLGKGSSSLPDRITALLLAGDLQSRGNTTFPLCLGALCLALLLGHDAVHDSLEHLMSLFAGL